jgi:ribosomal protein S6--L-glutamate ligase
MDDVVGGTVARSGSLHIGLLVEARYLKQRQPGGLKEALEARRHEVSLFDPSKMSYRADDPCWAKAFDLVVARGRSWALLAVLGWAEGFGVPTINRRDAIAGVHDKAQMAFMLAHAAVPTPTTFIGPIEELKLRIPAHDYPLIIKPIFGDNSRGLHVVHRRQDLDAIHWSEPQALAQTYIRSDGYDLKLYGIGLSVFAVRRPSPLAAALMAEASDAELVSVTPELETLARRCREPFGLELFGVDCIETSTGPVVIEVNDFPNYTGVPNGSEVLADYVLSRAMSGSRS